MVLIDMTLSVSDLKSHTELRSFIKYGPKLDVCHFQIISDVYALLFTLVNIPSDMCRKFCSIPAPGL